MSEDPRGGGGFGSDAVRDYSSRKLEQFGENGGSEVEHRGAVRGLISTMANTPRPGPAAEPQNQNQTRTAPLQLHSTGNGTTEKFGSWSELGESVPSEVSS